MAKDPDPLTDEELDAVLRRSGEAMQAGLGDLVDTEAALAQVEREAHRRSAAVGRPPTGQTPAGQQSAARHALTLAVSDPPQLTALRQWLREGLPQVQVEILSGQPGPNELGAVDVISVLAGSSGLVAAVKMLPEFIRSRRSGFQIEAAVRGKKFTLRADNAASAQDLLPILDRLLDD
jgi:Effector Associated Constant Component 1